MGAGDASGGEQRPRVAGVVLNAILRTADKTTQTHLLLSSTQKRLKRKSQTVESTTAEYIAALFCSILTRAVDTDPLAVCTRVPVVNEEVFLTQLGRAVAVLREVTLPGGRPAHLPFRLHLMGRRESHSMRQQRSRETLYKLFLCIA